MFRFVSVPNNALFYRVPPFLSTIEDPRAVQGGAVTGCPFCGGTCILFLNSPIHPYIFLQDLDTVFPIVRNWRILNGEKWHLIGPTKVEDTRVLCIYVVQGSSEKYNVVLRNQWTLSGDFHMN
jgi:hypothetical protein